MFHVEQFQIWGLRATRQIENPGHFSTDETAPSNSGGKARNGSVNPHAIG